MKANKPYSITGDLKAFQGDYIERYYHDKTIGYLTGTIDRQKKLIDNLFSQLETLQRIGLNPDPRPTRDGKIIRLNH